MSEPKTHHPCDYCGGWDSEQISGAPEMSMLKLDFTGIPELEEYSRTCCVKCHVKMMDRVLRDN